jgi:hypothetical protein
VWFVLGAVDVEHPVCCGSWWSIGQSSVPSAPTANGVIELLTDKNENRRTKSNKLKPKLLTQPEPRLFLNKLSSLLDKKRTITLKVFSSCFQASFAFTTIKIDPLPIKAFL